MSGSIHNRQRPLLPAGPQQPTKTVSLTALTRHPRVGVSIACETCRKRKVRCNGHRPRCAGCLRANSTCTYKPATTDHELRRQFKDIEAERRESQSLIDLLRSRNPCEASFILELLRQGTSVRDILRQVEHGDILCELSLVPKDSYVSEASCVS